VRDERSVAFGKGRPKGTKNPTDARQLRSQQINSAYGVTPTDLVGKGVQVTHPNSNPLARLEQLVLDRTVPLSDVLRAVVVLANSTDAAALRAWASVELAGYPGINVPEYRKVRALIMERIQVFGPIDRPTPILGPQPTQADARELVLR
jgi:hypothetical protein